MYVHSRLYCATDQSGSCITPALASNGLAGRASEVRKQSVGKRKDGLKEIELDSSSWESKAGKVASEGRHW
jgi:hypothetical protein